MSKETSKETRQQGFRRSATFQEHELKVCDLCSSLNLATNAECFVCGWNGHFERDHRVVHSALTVAIQQHGRLELHNLTDIQTYRNVRPGLKSRLRAWIDRLRTWIRSHVG